MNTEEEANPNMAKTGELNEEEPASRIIRAAGGLVQNERGEVLFIYRRNKWDLPKGKIDAGESPEECAVREVQEETGMREVILKDFLLITHHTYEESGKNILKETHWFRMLASGEQELIPQAEEDITGLKWVRQDGFAEMIQNTYPNILEVLKKAGYRRP
jgi:8-oxo-dGTP pyrophosphatase MutT (NUDIX family)